MIVHVWKQRLEFPGQSIKQLVYQVVCWRRNRSKIHWAWPLAYGFMTIETTIVWDHDRFRPLSFYARLKWSCFDLLCMKFLWSTFHFFVGDLKFCKVAIRLKFCKVTPFCVQGWLTLGRKCTRTLKHRRGQKTLHISGLEESVAPLKCHLY